VPNEKVGKTSIALHAKKLQTYSASKSVHELTEDDAMNFNLKTQLSRILLATSLLFCITAIQAASGFNVRPEQEGTVKVGMTMAEVEQALGRPARSIKYRTEPGPTWTYNVLVNTVPPTVVEVNFGADGKVTSVGQRMLTELDSDDRS
jgi:outer membrane protein assembly factor BamE (lipoprotein component of BamABCDE complex)